MRLWLRQSEGQKQRVSSEHWGISASAIDVATPSKADRPQSAAGVLDYLISNLLQTLMSECSTPAAAGYDMTESFLGCVRDFLLAEAQECYWQQAVLRQFRRAQTSW